MRQIFTAKKLEDAKRQAVQAFGVSESQIVFRILEQKKGLMGIGASVTIEAIYEPPVAAVETPAPAAEPMPEPQAAAPVVEETVKTITETVVEPETDAVVEETVSVTETVTVTEPAADAESEAVATESAEPLSLDSLTPEQQAAVKRVQDYVAAVYEKLGVTVTTTPKVQENGILLEISSNSRGGTIIGRRGETLDAMQYLSSIIANKGEEDYCRIILDSNGYREKRRQTLEHLAERLAKTVIRNQRATTLEPMNPYERRIIHAKVAEIDGVSSKSVGEDPYRKVVILPLDENGEPLIGVSIVVKGTSTGTITDFDGKFSINLPAGSKELVVSYIGYKEQTVAVTGNAGNRKRNGNNTHRNREEEIPHKPTNFDDIMSTSFEKDYRKPKPEDDLQVGLYGKIE